MSGLTENFIFATGLSKKPTSFLNSETIALLYLTSFVEDENLSQR